MTHSPSDFMQVASLDEIVFEKRNKSYGAYELRKHYGLRLRNALLTTMSLSLICFLILNFFMNRQQKKNDIGPLVYHVDTIRVYKIIPPPPRAQAAAAEIPESKIPTKITSDSSVTENKPKPDTTKTLASNGTGDRKIDTSAITSSGKGTTNDSAKGSAMNGTGATGFEVAPEIFPSFPGGQKALAKYFQKNLNCNNDRIESNEGKIIIQFIVKNDGSTYNVKVLKENVGVDCAEEAKHAIENSKWNPGFQNKHAVNVMMVLPITIQKQ